MDFVITVVSVADKPARSNKVLQRTRAGDYFTRLSVAKFADEPTFVPDKVFRAVDTLTLVFAVFVCKVFGPVPRRTLRRIEPGFCFRFCHKVQVCSASGEPGR